MDVPLSFPALIVIADRTMSSDDAVASTALSPSPPTDDILSELKARILSLSEHIKSLKASSDDGDKYAITTAVAQLLGRLSFRSIVRTF